MDISLARDSPGKKTQSPLKSRLSPEKAKKIEEKEEEESGNESDDGSFKSGQRKRLRALASKFNNYDEEDSIAIKQIAKVCW